MAEVVVSEAISGPAMEENALMSAMQDAKAIIVRNQTQVSAALLEKSSQ